MSQTECYRACSIAPKRCPIEHFVTTVTWQRTPLFRNPQRAGLMIEVLAHYCELKKYLLNEFVIMPDHLHILLTPAAEISLERAMQFIKGGFSYRLGKTKRGLVWQESFTNHRIRDKSDYERHAEYIRMNPVRSWLVTSPELYLYSSAGVRAAIKGRREIDLDGLSLLQALKGIR